MFERMRNQFDLKVADKLAHRTDEDRIETLFEVQPLVTGKTGFVQNPRPNPKTACMGVTTCSARVVGVLIVLTGYRYLQHLSVPMATDYESAIPYDVFHNVS